MSDVTIPGWLNTPDDPEAVQLIKSAQAMGRVAQAYEIHAQHAHSDAAHDAWNEAVLRLLDAQAALERGAEVLQERTGIRLRLTTVAPGVDRRIVG